jgi:hypothetical protein
MGSNVGRDNITNLMYRRVEEEQSFAHYNIKALGAVNLGYG